MIDHEQVTTAMNVKQVLVNWKGNHPIKEILRVIMANPDSAFNVSMKESLDGPGDNYAKGIVRINDKLLLREPLQLQQDRIAMDMLLNEKLKNIARQDRRNCIELTILRNQGKLNVRQLLEDPQMANHFRLRVLHYKYATLMDACLGQPRQDPMTETYLPVEKGYKMAAKVTSKEIRAQLQESPTEIEFKLQIPREAVIEILPKVNKLKCIRAKNLALRLLHGDLYTGTRLLKFGMTDSDKCPRCNNSEDLDHLLKNCWYTKIIWAKISNLYKLTDQRRQTYDRDSMAFVIGATLSKAKLKLHIEIARRLCNKDRPNILPKSLITQALDYLIICDTENYKYYKRLRQSI